MRSPARKRVAADQPSAVDALLDASKHPERALIDAVRSVIARAVPMATESVKWNAPSFAAGDHFATLHLRAKVGVQLILHLGAKARPDVDMRTVLPRTSILEWKGAERAVVTIRDAVQLSALRAELTRILKVWVKHVASQG